MEISSWGPGFKYYYGSNICDINIMKQKINKTNFFKQYGNSIEIKNFNDLRSIINSIDITVEERTHDTSKEELWILMRALDVYFEQISQFLPVKFIKSQQPDILVERNGIIEYGYEITESTNANYLAAIKLAERRNQGEWPVDSCFKYGKRPHNLEQTLQHPDKELWGEPWEGEEGINNTILFLKDSINKKLNHLNRHKYQNLEDVRLLTYFTGPSCIHTKDDQIKKAFPKLIDKILSETNYERKFSHFYLLWSRTKRCEDTTSPYIVL
jgi:hypothetical protein